MKRKSILSLLLVSAIIGLTFSACTGMKATVSGLENEGYLEFVSSVTKYSNRVEVYVGERSPFYAKVFMEKPNRTKTERYAIPPGTHDVRVRYNGMDIYQQKVFIGAQETRKIVLP
jgi:outer membrane usher protein FimD/PapC